MQQNRSSNDAGDHAGMQLVDVFPERSYTFCKLDVDLIRLK